MSAPFLPPPKMPVGKVRKRWEYATFTTERGHMTLGEMNRMGSEGWELVGFESTPYGLDSWRYVFKRRA